MSQLVTFHFGRLRNMARGLRAWVQHAFGVLHSTGTSSRACPHVSTSCWPRRCAFRVRISGRAPRPGARSSISSLRRGRASMLQSARLLSSGWLALCDHVPTADRRMAAGSLGRPYGRPGTCRHVCPGSPFDRGAFPRPGRAEPGGLASGHPRHAGGGQKYSAQPPRPSGRSCRHTGSFCIGRSDPAALYGARSRSGRQSA